jgi:hypothetical protein
VRASLLFSSAENFLLKTRKWTGCFVLLEEPDASVVFDHFAYFNLLSLNIIT